MVYLGFDLGSSSVKVALVDADSGKSIRSINEPSNEMEILALHNDWAEQNPGQMSHSANDRDRATHNKGQVNWVQPFKHLTA